MGNFAIRNGQEIKIGIRFNFRVVIGCLRLKPVCQGTRMIGIGRKNLYNIQPRIMHGFRQMTGNIARANDNNRMNMKVMMHKILFRY